MTPTEWIALVLLLLTVAAALVLRHVRGRAETIGDLAALLDAADVAQPPNHVIDLDPQDVVRPVPRRSRSRPGSPRQPSP